MSTSVRREEEVATVYYSSRLAFAFGKMADELTRQSIDRDSCPFERCLRCSECARFCRIKQFLDLKRVDFIEVNLPKFA